ncbi:MAG: acyl carrier protein [Lysobacter sp.]|nr:acyl carrier protein [Lysobacter sp.]
MNTVAQGLDTLRDWLLEKNPDLDAIDDDLDLFESKLIDSINFVEFILIIEELIDREIPVSSDLVARTSTLRLVSENYLRLHEAV